MDCMHEIKPLTTHFPPIVRYKLAAVRILIKCSIEQVFEFDVVA